MTTRRRRRPTSLLLPEALKPPKLSGEANTRYAKAIKEARAAVEAVRESRSRLRQAERQDAPPAEIRKLTEKAEDAEHTLRQAKRDEAAAKAELAQAIKADSAALVEQLPITGGDEEIRRLLSDLGAALNRQEENVGALTTIATVEEERTQARGFEPIRSTADRSNRPEAHLGALADWADELRGIAERVERRAQLRAERGSRRRKVAAA